MIFYASNFYFFKKVGYLIRKETKGGRYTFSQWINSRIVSMCQQLWELININYLPISIKACSESVTIPESQMYTIWRLPMKQSVNPRLRGFTYQKILFLTLTLFRSWRPVTFIRPASFILLCLDRGWYLQLYMGVLGSSTIAHLPFYTKTFGGHMWCSSPK